MNESLWQIAGAVAAIASVMLGIWAMIRSSNAALRAELTTKIDALGTGLKEARAESTKQHDALRADFKGDLALLRERVGRMDARTAERMNRVEHILEALRGSSTKQEPAASS